MSTVLRKSTRKSEAVQTAIIVRRALGHDKAKIARDLGIKVNTVTSILELRDVESQIAKYREDALAICPDAITAVHNQVKNGDGDLGLRLLERTGVIGEDAIQSVRRNSARSQGAINILVQPGATIAVNTNGNKQASDSGSGAEVPSEGLPPTS